MNAKTPPLDGKENTHAHTHHLVIVVVKPCAAILHFDGHTTRPNTRPKSAFRRGTRRGRHDTVLGHAICKPHAHVSSSLSVPHDKITYAKRAQTRTSRPLGACTHQERARLRAQTRGSVTQSGSRRAAPRRLPSQIVASRQRVPSTRGTSRHARARHASPGCGARLIPGFTPQPHP